MTFPSIIRARELDPLFVALALFYPVNHDVLYRAIVYRESVIDGLREEIEVLQRAMARLPGQKDLPFCHSERSEESRGGAP